MAYFCLTVIEASMGAPRKGQRRRAATTYGFDPAVLDKLGDLVSDVGDAETRRKQHAKDPRPYTDAEAKWMRAVARMMMLRMGEWAFDQNKMFNVLTMNDFPDLQTARGSRF
jgi:hypothetical protein